MFACTVRTTHNISMIEITTRMTPTMASTGASSPSARIADLHPHDAPATNARASRSASRSLTRRTHGTGPSSSVPAVGARLQSRHELGQVTQGVDRARPKLGQERLDTITILMAHDGHHAAAER